jgi:hypothetical protein
MQDSIQKQKWLGSFKAMQKSFSFILDHFFLVCLFTFWEVILITATLQFSSLLLQGIESTFLRFFWIVSGNIVLLLFSVLFATALSLLYKKGLTEQKHKFIPILQESLSELPKTISLSILLYLLIVPAIYLSVFISDFFLSAELFIPTYAVLAFGGLYYLIILIYFLPSFYLSILESLSIREAFSKSIYLVKGYAFPVLSRITTLFLYITVIQFIQSIPYIGIWMSIFMAIFLFPLINFYYLQTIEELYLAKSNNQKKSDWGIIKKIGVIIYGCFVIALFVLSLIVG